MAKMLNLVFTRIKSFDWAFIRGSSLNSLGIAFARVLGFAYTFIAAKVLSTSEFGHVTYVLALSGIVAIVARPFGPRVIAYYIGKYADDENAFDDIMPHIWMTWLIIFVLSVIVSIPILLATSNFSWELMIVYAGTVIFYTYYGVASGFLASGRLVGAYIGSNVVQIMMLVILVYVFNVRSTAPVIAIYGLSYFIPVYTLWRFAPLNIKLQFSANFRKIKDIIRFSIPIWLSHALYVGFISLDVLFLERFTTNAEVGIYGLTKTLASVFYFVPNGITMLLLPKLAGMTGQRKQIVGLALGISLAVNIVGLSMYMVVYPWFVNRFFPEYYLNMQFAFTAALGAILFGIHSILAATSVGINRASVETVSRIFMTITTVVGGFLIIPRYGAVGASMTLALAATSGLIVFVMFVLFSKKKKHTTD